MRRPLTLAEIAAACGSVASGEASFRDVSTDTRTLGAGALFVALRGERFDGHDFLGQAAEKGAAGFLLSRPLAASEPALPHAVVPDTLVALGKIARLERDAFAGPVVAVTGSVGKTTVKEMVATVLEAGFAVHRSAGNFNNEVGLPRTLLSLPESAGALVVEMGMRGPGQIQALCQIAAPTLGIVTGIGLSHLELLGSRAALAAAKGELFEALPADGLAVFPATDDFARDLRAKSKAPALTCALDAPADIIASGLARHENGWRASVETPWGRTKLFVPSPGRFNVLNALFAVAVGGHLQIPLEAIARALLRFSPPPMRLEIRDARGVQILADCYNAAPDSMVGALQTLAETPVGAGGKRIAVLGEMRELGKFAPEAHAMVGRVTARLKPDMLVLVGTSTRSLSAAALMEGYPRESLHYFDETMQAAELLPLIVQPGDAVLVKGSRALEMERIVAALGAEAAH